MLQFPAPYYRRAARLCRTQTKKRFLRGSVPFAAATGIMVNEVMKFITSYDKEVGEAIEVE